MNFRKWSKDSKLVKLNSEWKNEEKLEFVAAEKMIDSARNIDLKNNMKVSAYPDDYQKDLVKVLELE